jgi:group I intron endonuclease
VLDPRKPGIYRIVNLVTKREYIGSSKCPELRWKHHRSSLNKGRHCNPQLQRSWNAHGSVAFEFEMISNCKIESLIVEEQLAIDLGHKLFNVAKSATPGPKNARTTWSDERRTKQKLMMLGNTNLRGHIASEETREKQSVSRTGKTPKRGASWRNAASNRMSAMNSKINATRPQNTKGKRLSEDHKSKLKGKKLSPEHWAKLREAIIASNKRRAVKCL